MNTVSASNGSETGSGKGRKGVRDEEREAVAEQFCLDWFQLLASLGLLHVVWPSTRVMQGLRTCKWMSAELLVNCVFDDARVQCSGCDVSCLALTRGADRPTSTACSSQPLAPSISKPWTLHQLWSDSKARMSCSAARSRQRKAPLLWLLALHAMSGAAQGVIAAMKIAAFEGGFGEKLHVHSAFALSASYAMSSSDIAHSISTSGAAESVKRERQRCRPRLHICSAMPSPDTAYAGSRSSIVGECMSLVHLVSSSHSIPTHITSGNLGLGYNKLEDAGMVPRKCYAMCSTDTVCSTTRSSNPWGGCAS
eukprot:802064-Rhodomonas_salina.6